MTDWPISDHMIGTSHRGPVQRSVFLCGLQIARSDRGAAHSQGVRTVQNGGRHL
ncbi:unnamed protein product [Staurois parvus]|uniref:Uncharacterized protein n=1 Tax=Staurois parvus TaxID=386267 RepID=A0ABN9EF20_9NEOB|nr:unnamed protein product [Staurois parvus]